MTRTRTFAAACTAVAALALAACGGSSTGGASSAPASSGPASSAPASSATATTPEPTSPADPMYATSDCASLEAPTFSAEPPSGGTAVDAVTVTGKEDEAPSITIGPDAQPATELLSEDIVVGDGAVAKAGATITVNYCGVGLASQALFDSSWARGEPAQFPLSGLIPGWEEGIPGMKVGGRRLLVIPGSLAYGPQGSPDGSILPDETLAFVVDLVSIP